MTNQLVVIGSVTAAEYGPARTRIFREGGSSPRITRVSVETIAEFQDRMRVHLDELDPHMFEHSDEITVTAFVRTIQELFGIDANTISAILLSPEAFDLLSESTRTHTILDHRLVTFVPSIRFIAVARTTDTETWLEEV